MIRALIRISVIHHKTSPLRHLTQMAVCVVEVFVRDNISSLWDFEGRLQPWLGPKDAPVDVRQGYEQRTWNRHVGRISRWNRDIVLLVEVGIGRTIRFVAVKRGDVADYLTSILVPKFLPNARWGMAMWRHHMWNDLVERFRDVFKADVLGGQARRNAPDARMAIVCIILLVIVH